MHKPRLPVAIPPQPGSGVAINLPGGKQVMAPNETAAKAVRAALSQLGVPYVWGGTARGSGLDCSGLTMTSYQDAGLQLPRTAAQQTVGAEVPSIDQLLPGDLVVWSGHVAMVIGDGRGKLLRLWLAPTAVNLGDRLGPLVVEIAQAAMREATQDGYNKVALLLGEDMTALIERMTGMPAPARAEDDDPGMTVEEFQRLRAERLGSAPPAASPAAPAVPSEDEDAYWETFDPASLRSDR